MSTRFALILVYTVVAAVWILHWFLYILVVGDLISGEFIKSDAPVCTRSRSIDTHWRYQVYENDKNLGALIRGVNTACARNVYLQ